jgi:hypothetical protein
MSISTGPTPYYKKLMVFIDGSNFLIELSKTIGIPFRAEKPPIAVFNLVAHVVNPLCSGYGVVEIRRYWFASYQGSDETYGELCNSLRQSRFEPVLFRKTEGKEKGVDIALTKEMLVNAFNRNFDIGLLIAGDADYVSLVQEVKRYGPEVNGAFFNRGLSPQLCLAFDSFRIIPDDCFGNTEKLLEAIAQELSNQKKKE